MAKILHSELLETSAHPKEACLFPLERDRLAVFYDQGRQLMMRVSVDRGRSWGKPQPLKTTRAEPIRGYRTSPVRLRSGAIGLFHTYLPHVRRGRDGPLRFRASTNEGKTWSDGIFVNPTFAVQRNGTARVVAKGRIVAPVFVWLSSLAGGESESEDNSTCFSWTYFSDDDGATWKSSESELLVRQDKGRGGYYSFEEPCIEELHDGRLLMFGRTELGRQFVSYSKDRGESWTEPQPGPLASAYAPTLLARIPKTHDLLTIWNQASPQEILSGLHRHRLSCAISADDGKTWKHFRNLESRDEVTHIEPPPIKVYRMENYKYAGGPPARICYPSVAFLRDEAIVSYDYGEIDNKGKREHATKNRRRAGGVVLREVKRGNGYQILANQSNRVGSRFALQPGVQGVTGNWRIVCWATTAAERTLASAELSPVTPHFSGRDGWAASREFETSARRTRARAAQKSKDLVLPG